MTRADQFAQRISDEALERILTDPATPPPDWAAMVADLVQRRATFDRQWPELTGSADVG